MKKDIIPVIVVIAILLGVGGYLVTQHKDKAPMASDTTSITPTTDSTNNTTTPAEESSSNIISYTDNGFSPGKITIKAGETVTIKNVSSHPLQFDSDPHPAHTDNKELNIETVSPGKSQTVTLSTKGTWGYHNHLNSTDTGTIIVQ